MKLIKKLLAILMASIMVFGLLACGQEATTPTNPVSGEEGDPRIAGMVVFSSDASVGINYDAEGMVLSISGISPEGDILAQSVGAVEGLTCSDLVAKLTDESAKQALLSTTVIIKQSFGSALPGSNFLETLVSAIEAAAEEASAIIDVIMISAEQLDENGYINLETSKTIMLSKLGLQSASTFDGTPSPDTNGDYMFYIAEGDLEGTFLLNAVTGLVTELSEEDLRQMEGMGEAEIPEEETNFDNLPTTEGEATTGATEAVTEPVDATEATTEATEATEAQA